MFPKTGAWRFRISKVKFLRKLRKTHLDVTIKGVEPNPCEVGGTRRAIEPTGEDPVVMVDPVDGGGQEVVVLVLGRVVVLLDNDVVVVVVVRSE